MRSKLATYALAGALGLSGVAGAALVGPAVSYAAPGDSAAPDGRVSRIQQALAGLVTDGTLTQAQADRVATTLAEATPDRRPGGHRGMHLQAAAAALDLTVVELRAAAQQGKSLADLAAEQGVSQDALVEALVAAAKEKLDAAVADERLTRAEADEKLAGTEARIRERLADPLPTLSRPGRGR